jgi:hypothetical protein
MVDLDGIFVLMPVTPMVPALAHEIERARVEAGLSVKEMLASLRDQRKRDVREQYGSAHRWRQPSVFLDADVIFAGAACKDVEARGTEMAAPVNFNRWLAGLFRLRWLIV